MTTPDVQEAHYFLAAPGEQRKRPALPRSPRCTDATSEIRHCRFGVCHRTRLESGPIRIPLFGFMMPGPSTKQLIDMTGSFAHVRLSCTGK